MGVLDDVAAHCGVSYQTVSRVVNNSPLVKEKTRARVLKSVAELNRGLTLARSCGADGLAARAQEVLDHGRGLR